ncbi:unnamed protein product [Echinostoma caproni]|uniref:Ovule protein n=1 Tax=Echinostoma caproni TaxID=27848 RepID=A0A183AJH7_9TREM|nr:unnamed protein product [Echinostoma caproni]
MISFRNAFNNPPIVVVNLVFSHASVVGLPRFFSFTPDFETLHFFCQVLNSRLNMCCELTQILTNDLQSRHSSHLAWMIIILILIELEKMSFHLVPGTPLSDRNHIFPVTL